MSNVLEAVSKLKLKNSKNHFFNLVLYCQITAKQAYEGSHFNKLLQTSHEDTCLSSTEVTKNYFY